MRITAATITALRREAKARAMQIVAIRPDPEGFSALLVRPKGPSAADVTITTPTLQEPPADAE